MNGELLKKAGLILLMGLILYIAFPKYDFFVLKDGQVCRANKISGKLERSGAIFDDDDFRSKWGF